MTNALLIALILASSLTAAVAVRKWIFRRNRSRYRVEEYPDFLSPEECNHIIELARPLVQKSGVLHKGGIKTGSAVRTSNTAFFRDSRDAVVLRVKNRIAEVSQTDLRCQEPLQVTYYETTQFFAPHFDSLRKGSGDLGAPGDRQSTMILYLNDDYTGGQTQFHRIGVTVEPERGKAVFFTNLTEDGSARDPLSLHGAKAVRSGEKWLLNQWIRERPFATQNRGARRAKAKRKKSG